MDQTSKIDDKLLWAFAVDATKPLQINRSRNRRAAKPKYKLHRYQMTVCSPKLKQIGVRSGMSYGEAKRLAPNMHVFVYNR
jgi:hypothetical protein